jgi:16S rRNA (uracil1498-N3)-methyltransferase
MEAKELFYVNPEDVNPGHLQLRGDEFHHLIHVFRKGVGAKFSATDGAGSFFDCEIDSVETQSLSARIIKKRRFVGEPLFKLTLALAILKKGRFEWVVEKATEVGVSSFVPVLTERTILPGNSIDRQRCSRIALSAMKQSWRSILPTVSEPQKFETLCENAGDYDLKVLAHEKTTERSVDLIQAAPDHRLKSGVLCIGPEGGFTDREIDLARESGFTLFGMGPRRLRAETAALVGAALVLDRLGELR